MGKSLKRKKYEELLDRFYFVPFSVKTLGPLEAEAKNLINKISQLRKGVGGDSRVKSFIIQDMGKYRLGCLEGPRGFSSQDFA